MNRLLMQALGAVAAVAFASGALAQEYGARLGRVPVDTRTQSAVAGLGHASAELAGNRLTIEGDFSGLLGAATTASLNMGIAVGARGPVIHALQIETMREGSLTGSVTLTDEQLAALRAGRLYIQIDSESAPDGNLWGWLLGEE